MSDYKTTNCIRLETEYVSIEDILKSINHIELLKYYVDDYELFNINDKLKSEKLRIVEYDDCYYVDIILCNDYSDRCDNDGSFYMSLKTIKSYVLSFTSKWQNFKYVDIIILAHQWYNGCDEPYT